MYINKRNSLPSTQPMGNTNISMHVFIYYMDNSRFCLGYYDFQNKMWFDNDGMVINEDFLWCYLPVKQMKAFIQNTRKSNVREREYLIDGEKYKMFTLEIKGKWINVASYNLEEKISKMIEEGRYKEIKYIDEMYGYCLPQDIDDTNADEIRESIEDVYEE